MGQIYDSISTALDGAYKLPHVAGDKLDKTDLKLAAEVITNGVEVFTDKRITVTSLVSDIQSLDINNKVAYCNETAMMYGYISDISVYVQYGGTVIQSNISGGWVERDAYNKFMQPSNIISLEHMNQSSTITLTGGTNFTAKSDLYINNGHTHVCKLFCNGYTPTFSGFEFLTNSSPLELDTIDITPGYYHTVVFFKMANVNKFIILEKVLSSDVTPPTITVSVASKTDTTITYTVNSNENSELKWALYLGGSSGKTTADIDNGIDALQHGAKSLTSGNNTLTITSLSELTTYDLWQYAYDAISNNSTPAKTTVQTNETGVSQLVAPILGTVTVLSPTSLSVPIATSSIDANASSVSLYYKRAADPTYTVVTNIGKTDVSHTLSALDVNTQYYIYLVAVGDGISYSNSVPSNIATPTTQNIAPTLSVPYTSSSGLVIELPFSRAMANPSTQSGLFTLSGGKSVVSVALKSGDATKIQVTVDSAYLADDTITISIVSGLVPADNGVVFGGVSNQSVTNNNVVVAHKSLSLNNTANYTRSTINGMPTSNDTQFSVSAWINVVATTNISGTIVAMPNSSFISMTLTVQDTGKVAYIEYNAGTSTSYILHNTTSSIPLNQWVHITLSYDNTDVKIYFNGILQTMETIGTPVQWAMPLSFNIGGCRNFYLSGKLNDVCMYNRVLTPTEVTEISTLLNGRAINISTTSVSNVITSYFRLDGSSVDVMGINTSTNVGTPIYSINSII